MDGFIVQCPNCKQKNMVEVTYFEPKEMGKLGQLFTAIFEDQCSDRFSGHSTCTSCGQIITAAITITATEDEEEDDDGEDSR